MHDFDDTNLIFMIMKEKSRTSPVTVHRNCSYDDNDSSQCRQIWSLGMSTGNLNFEQESYTFRHRRMVPRASTELDHGLSSDDICDPKGDCDNPDYNKNDTSTIIDSLMPFEKDPKIVSWKFENELSGNESRTSLIEEQIVIPETRETMLSVAFQVFVPFLIAGFGTVGAGLVLDIVQHWDVFRVVSEIFILVPALLGLKGNLEMTLASRLSTQANMGRMDTHGEQWKLAVGNMALIQCQATVVGFLASIFAMIMGWIPEGKFNISHAFLLCASSLVTASLASFILGCVMIAVVIFSRKVSINPDNVATPIAASLGDLTTLCLLAGISYLLYGKLDSPGFPVTIIIFFLLLIPLWVTIAKQNRFTREVLYSGWTPVISAMAISSVGGLILDFAVDRFHGIAVFQPVINGVGGNLVAVQASRISTYLHQRSKLGVLPPEDSQLCRDPISAFFGKSIHAMTARVLMLLVIPGHLIFVYGIRFVNAGHTSVTTVFLSLYLLAAVLQVLLLLYCAHVMIHWMWTNQVDPDNSAIPYLTAFGDLLGTALLAVAFYILYCIGDKDADVGE